MRKRSREDEWKSGKNIYAPANRGGEEMLPKDKTGDAHQKIKGRGRIGD